MPRKALWELNRGADLGHHHHVSQGRAFGDTCPRHVLAGYLSGRRVAEIAFRRRFRRGRTLDNQLGGGRIVSGTVRRLAVPLCWGDRLASWYGSRLQDVP